MGGGNNFSEIGPSACCILQIAAERDYAVRTGREEGHAAGLEEGKAKGKAEEKIETAKKFKAAGIAEEIISQCTGLSIEEVRAL